MGNDEFLSDDYNPIPLKETARFELYPLGTAKRIAELEAAAKAVVKLFYDPAQPDNKQFAELVNLHSVLAQKP